jgi:hypothetical protein
MDWDNENGGVRLAAGSEVGVESAADANRKRRAQKPQQPMRRMQRWHALRGVAVARGKAWVGNALPHWGGGRTKKKLHPHLAEIFLEVGQRLAQLGARRYGGDGSARAGL